MKRQLGDLEKKIEEAEAAAAARRDRSNYGAIGASKTTLVKRQLEQMLDYKRQQLRDLDDISKDGNRPVGTSLSALREDLNMITQQVDALENHLGSREEVLAQLREEVDQLRASR